ncbi:MAG: TonB-dependent receptor, partial [Bacteroidota bacterium]
MRNPILLFTLLLLCFSVKTAAQNPGGGRPGGQGGGEQRQQMSIGRFYGKVIDDATGKGIGYASVQLIGMKFDTTQHRMVKGLIAGQLTEENGDFSLENLPIRGDFTLKIAFLGYASTEQTVTFGIPGRGQEGQPGDKKPEGQQGFNGKNGQGNSMKMNPGAFDKDLGNIRLGASAEILKEVTIEGNSGQITLALDKKVYHVDKDASAAGGTAEDALKNIPSLNVDIDGNLTMRSAAPQLFVDGRPTNLTLDQIPSDAIDNVEVITNPSAKYDASGGNAGIVNIVLKKDRRVGYNGSVRGGVDARGRVNLGGDLNAREGKINVFVGGNLNQRKSISSGGTDRYNLTGNPLTNVFQQSASQNTGYFAMGRGGIDWFIDNRNTLTASGNYNGGNFDSGDDLKIQTDTLRNSGLRTGHALRNSSSSRNHGSYGSQLLYKHLFPKEGKELTADLNLNGSRSKSQGNFTTNYLDQNRQSVQRQEGKGSNAFFTAQTDFSNPLNGGRKMELGARAAIRDFRSENNSFNRINNEYVLAPNFAGRYKFNDQVYAAYGTFSQSYPKWGFQGGLRAESSVYTGVLLGNDSTFTNKYPISLFPSAFATYKINDADNVQLSYSRRINRPNFFQLIPFPDFSDSLQLSVGNPGLKPEFTNSLELSYQNIINSNHNVLVSVYYKRASNLITRYQSLQKDVIPGRNVIVSTYQNSNSSTAYGTELTVKNTVFKIVDITSNINLYNSIVDARNISANLKIEQFTWFIKENLSLRLPLNITFQANGSYQSRTAFSIDGGREGGFRGGGGGGGWGGGPTNTAQGYSIPVWFVDLSLRKDLWKRKASITLSVQDVFRSRRNGSHAESAFFIQDTWRRRDPQLARINFSYRFG